MEKYVLFVGGAVIECEGSDQEDAIDRLNLFEDGEQIDSVRAYGDEGEVNAWIYEIVTMKGVQIGYIKRIS